MEWSRQDPSFLSCMGLLLDPIRLDLVRPCDRSVGKRAMMRRWALKTSDQADVSRPINFRNLNVDCSQLTIPKIRSRMFRRHRRCIHERFQILHFELVVKKLAFFRHPNFRNGRNHLRN